MDIAMLGHKRIPSREGGIEVVVGELSVGMVRRGHTVTCFNRTSHCASNIDNAEERQSIYEGVMLKDVFTVDRKGIAAVSSSITATVKAAFGRYKVVHIHAEGPALLCWLPRLMGKKVIVTIHGLDWARAKWGRLASLYIKTGEKNAARFAHSIIVLSSSVQEYFRKTYGRETVLIPNGVSRPEIREPVKIAEKWNLSTDDYLLFLGRIVPEKGVQYLIEAFKQTKTNKKLVIAGGSSDTDAYLAAMKQLAADDARILFTGFVQGRELEELYSNAYIYCLPSDLEGMPLSLLEAMSFGNCCLVSDIPECAEVVEDKAVLFRKSDTADLAQKLQMLCDNPELVEELKAQSSEFICRKYDWDDVVEKTLVIYHAK